MKKISNLELVGGLKASWYDCAYLTAGTVVTLTFVPLAGAFMAGYTAACWASQN